MSRKRVQELSVNFEVWKTNGKFFSFKLKLNSFKGSIYHNICMLNCNIFFNLINLLIGYERATLNSWRHSWSWKLFPSITNSHDIIHIFYKWVNQMYTHIQQFGPFSIQTRHQQVPYFLPDINSWFLDQHFYTYYSIWYVS